MDSNKNQIKIANLQMSLIDYSPVQYWNGKTDWVNYGKDNMYPKFLLSLMKKSSIHAAIQNGKHELATAGGLYFDTDDLTPEQIANAEKLYNTPNPKETFEKLYAKVMLDEIIFGGYALQVIWSKDRQTISEIYHVPFAKVRVGKEDENGQVNQYFISDNWGQYKKKEYEPKSIAAFSLTDRKDPRQLIYVKDYDGDECVYPSPMYVASINYVLIDYEIGVYHLNNIQNGLSPNFMMNVNSGIPSEDEQDQFFDNVKKNLQGSKGQKVMITWSEGKDHGTEIIPIQVSDADKQFLTLNEAVLQQLLSGNRLTSPMLVGIKTPGQLGGQNEIEIAFDIYYNQVITSLQKKVNESFETILKLNVGVDVEIENEKPKLFSETLSEAVQEKILTINELREKINYSALTVGDPSVEPVNTIDGNKLL